MFSKSLFIPKSINPTSILLLYASSTDLRNTIIHMRLGLILITVKFEYRAGPQATRVGLLDHTINRQRELQTGVFASNKNITREDGLLKRLTLVLP